MISGVITTETKTSKGVKTKLIWVQTQIKLAIISNSNDQRALFDNFLALFLFLNDVNRSVLNLHVDTTDVFPDNPNAEQL